MAITALPTPPSRSTPSDFSTKADAFIAALPVFVTEANAQAAALTLNDTTDASTSSVAIGTGAKTFTVTAGKSFQPGMWLVIADDAAPSTNAMYGTVTSYATDQLVMDIKTFLGTGTKAAWTISQSSPGGLIAGGALGTPASGVLTNCTGLPLATGLTPAATLISLEGLALVAGDLLYATAADTLINLTKGTANLKLFMNAAGTAPEWAAGLKVISFSRDISSYGVQAVTGVGFKPAAIIFMVSLVVDTSFMFTDGAATFSTSYQNGGQTGFFIVRSSSGNSAKFTLGSLDADGFTGTWANNAGSPVGTYSIYAICFR